MSGPDLVREEITPEHPYYNEAMQIGLLENLPKRAVGYLWNTIVGDQRFDLFTLETVARRDLSFWELPFVEKIEYAMEWLFGDE